MTPRSGGCNFGEDPACDAREAVPIWWPDPPSLVRLTSDTEAGSSAQFSLWRVPGPKRVCNVGTRLHLACQSLPSPSQVTLSCELTEGARFAFIVPSGADLQENQAAVANFIRILKVGKPISRRNNAGTYPSRLSIVHMRTFQALDGAVSGASHREIAAALFGSEAVGHRWHSDGDLRAQVRHLIRRGRALTLGGYRRLVTASNGKGDLRRSSKSP